MIENVYSLALVALLFIASSRVSALQESWISEAQFSLLTQRMCCRTFEGEKRQHHLIGAVVSPRKSLLKETTASLSKKREPHFSGAVVSHHKFCRTLHMRAAKKHKHRLRQGSERQICQIWVIQFSSTPITFTYRDSTTAPAAASSKAKKKKMRPFLPSSG